MSGELNKEICRNKESMSDCICTQTSHCLSLICQTVCYAT